MNIGCDPRKSPYKIQKTASSPRGEEERNEKFGEPLGIVESRAVDTKASPRPSGMRIAQRALNERPCGTIGTAIWRIRLFRIASKRST